MHIARYRQIDEQESLPLEAQSPVRHAYIAGDPVEFRSLLFVAGFPAICEEAGLDLFAGLR